MADIIIRATKAPALALCPTTFSQAHFDILNSQLRLYFNTLDAFTAAVSTPASGTTALRPTISLQVGQQYFDTTLGLPIWWNGTDWIDAAGTVV